MTYEIKMYPEARRLSVWPRSVWLGMIGTNDTLTMAQIERRFGPGPVCNNTSQQLLDGAVDKCFFRVLPGKVPRYYADRPQAANEPGESFFAGIRPVNSVWGLAA